MFAYEVRIILMRFCPRKLAPSLAKLGGGTTALAATGLATCAGCSRQGWGWGAGARETEISDRELVAQAHGPESSPGTFMLEVCVYFTTVT